MVDHNRCSKCESAHLLAIPPTPGDHSHIVVGDRLMRTVAVAKYVCTDCGFVEEWVNDTADLGQLKAEYRSRWGESAR
jgi:hypothetical protein